MKGGDGRRGPTGVVGSLRPRGRHGKQHRVTRRRWALWDVRVLVGAWRG